jgi:hypothetical protein
MSSMHDLKNVKIAQRSFSILANFVELLQLIDFSNL